MDGFAARRLARRIVEQEGVDPHAEAALLTDAAVHVCERLSARLSRSLTATATAALVTRALQLARLEFPFLDPVQVESTDRVCLVGLGKALPEAEPERAFDAVVTVFANVLRLVATFIGDELTLRAVSNVWPAALDPAVEDNRETAP